MSKISDAAVKQPSLPDIYSTWLVELSSPEYLSVELAVIWLKCLILLNHRSGLPSMDLSEPLNITNFYHLSNFLYDLTSNNNNEDWFSIAYGGICDENMDKTDYNKDLDICYSTYTFSCAASMAFTYGGHENSHCTGNCQTCEDFSGDDEYYSGNPMWMCERGYFEQILADFFFDYIISKSPYDAKEDNYAEEVGLFYLDYFIDEHSMDEWQHPELDKDTLYRIALLHMTGFSYPFDDSLLEWNTATFYHPYCNLVTEWLEAVYTDPTKYPELSTTDIAYVKQLVSSINVINSYLYADTSKLSIFSMATRSGKGMIFTFTEAFEDTKLSARLFKYFMTLISDCWKRYEKHILKEEEKSKKE